MTDARGAVADVLRLALAVVHRIAVRASSRRVGLVLVHHAVAADEPTGDEVVHTVAVEQLAMQVRHLRRAYRVVAAHDIVAAAQRRRRFGRIPVAVTFDDDLRSHVALAGPALSRLGVGATFFLTGASLGGPYEFWWEQLERVLAADGRADRVLRRFGLPRAAHATPRAVAEAAERLDPVARGELQRELAELAGPAPADSGLRAEHIVELCRQGHAIGFHTRRHAVLPELDDEALDAALRDGRSELEAVVGAALTTIAYPHGRADARVAARARAAGWEAGFVVGGRPVDGATDALLVERHEPAGRRPGRLALELARTVRHGR